MTTIYSDCKIHVVSKNIHFHLEYRISGGESRYFNNNRSVRILLVNGATYRFTSSDIDDLHSLLVSHLEGLKQRSRYMVVLHDSSSAGLCFISFFSRQAFYTFDLLKSLFFGLICFSPTLFYF